MHEGSYRMQGSFKKVPLLRKYLFMLDFISPIEFLTSPTTIIRKGKELNPDIFSFRMGIQPWIFISGKEGVQFFGKLQGDAVDPAFFRARLPALDLPGVGTPNLKHDATRAAAIVIKEHLEAMGKEFYFNLFIKQMATFFKENTKEQGIIENFSVFLIKLCMRITGSVFFGDEIYAKAPPGFEEAYMTVLGNSSLATVIFPFLRLPGDKKKFDAAKQMITDYLLTLINVHKKNKADYQIPMLIDRYIDLQNDHPEFGLRDIDLAYNLHATYWVAEVYIVAHIFWLLIEILSRPELLANLLKEQSQFEELNLASIDNMKVLHGTVRELMRLYSMPVLPRKVLKDLEFNGYLIPKNSVLAMSPYLEHQDPAVYPDPNKFDPTRWDTAPDADVYTAFFAGGIGVFRCIAQPFSIQLLMICTSYILRNYKLELTQKPPTVKQDLIFLPPFIPIPVRYQKLKRAQDPL
jgi:cytochrome P450